MGRNKNTTKPEVRMLTASEIESLRRDKEEAGLWLMREFRKSPRLLTPAELAALNGDGEGNEVEDIDSGDELVDEIVSAVHSTSRPLKETLAEWGVEKLSDLGTSEEPTSSTRKRIVQPLTDTDLE